MQRELQSKGSMFVLGVMPMDYDTRYDVQFCKRRACLLPLLSHGMNE